MLLPPGSALALRYDLVIPRQASKLDELILRRRPNASPADRANVRMGLGAEPVTTTVEGRERYTVSIRYPRDYRSDPAAIADQVLIPMTDGGTVPLRQVAKVSLAQGPSSIRTENAQLATYIYVDIRDRDIGGYVADAQKAVAAQVTFPQAITPSGAGSSSISNVQRHGSRSSCR